jgi:hypothetical protein
MSYIMHFKNIDRRSIDFFSLISLFVKSHCIFCSRVVSPIKLFPMGRGKIELNDFVTRWVVSGFVVIFKALTAVPIVLRRAVASAAESSMKSPANTV